MAGRMVAFKNRSRVHFKPRVLAQLYSIFNQFKAFRGPHFDAFQGSVNHSIIDWMFSKGRQDGMLVVYVHFVSIQRGNTINGGQKDGVGSKHAHSTVGNILELLRRSLYQCKDRVNRMPLLHQIFQTYLLRTIYPLSKKSRLADDPPRQLCCDISPRRFGVSSKRIVAHHLQIQHVVGDRHDICHVD
jgi:hypothetical protein